MDVAERYEIRWVTEPSDVALEYGLEWLYPRYEVWDTFHTKKVPFGNYRRHDQAVARILRIKEMTWNT